MPMSGDVVKFFDRESHHYHHPRREGMRHFHVVTARKLQRALYGKVLSIGGLWAYADLSAVGFKVTVVDISVEMLKHYQEHEVELVQCDARNLKFERDTFDHVVLPLVLHHITGPTGWSARDQVHKVLREAARVLKPGGHLWISEFVLTPLTYALELVATPLTRRLLGFARIPLVVMHSSRFYQEELRDAGFTNVAAERIQSPSAKATDWIQPIIGLKWLVVPRITYPVRPMLILAQKRQ